MKKIKVIPLIPSLNPDDKLINYIEQLILVGFDKIIIVNDGSAKKYDKYFNKLADYKECIIIKHAVNQGKGRALKTGFNYYLNNFKDYDGVVTADSDGQHSAQNTMDVAIQLSKLKNSLILGTRNFNEKHVPFKSKYGNKITTFIFKLLYGKKINDTQTGLRGIPNNFIKTCLELNGERFDYEINMLISSVKNKICIKEVIIDTIYIDDNKSSHFNPVSDSIRIYKILFSEFLKFTFSGIFSFVVDIALFSLLVKLFFNNADSIFGITFSTIIARIISSLINFSLNKNVVFQSNDNRSKLLLKYYLLCMIQMFFSAFGVSFLFKISCLSETICKIIIDFILFIISYNVQRHFIFKRKG